MKEPGGDWVRLLTGLSEPLGTFWFAYDMAKYLEALHSTVHSIHSIIGYAEYFM